MAKGSQGTGRGCRASTGELIVKTWILEYVTGPEQKEHSRFEAPTSTSPGEVGATPKGESCCVV